MKKVILGIALVLLLVGTSYAEGIYICIPEGSRGSGVLRWASSPSICPRNTTALLVNTQGIVGPQGPQGEKGDKGDKGEQGTPGIGGLGVFNGDGSLLGYLVYQNEMDGNLFSFIEPTYNLLVTIVFNQDATTNEYTLNEEEILQTWYASSDCSGDSRWSPHHPANILKYISYGEKYAIDDPSVPRVWCDAADPGGCPIHSYRDTNGVCWYRDAPQAWFYKVRIVSSPLPTLTYPVYVAPIAPVAPIE